VGAGLHAGWDLVGRTVCAEVTGPPAAAPAEPRGRALLLAMADIAPACTGEFSAWFTAQRRELAGHPGLRAIRRFEIVSGSPRHLVLYEAETVGDLPEVAEIAGTLAAWRPVEASPPVVRAFREGEPGGP